jgi:hypothetical protein
MARLYWPYLFLLSNGYARLELDFDAIADEFASFRGDAPSVDALVGFLAEYQQNNLILVYDSCGQRWGQWDTRRSNLGDYRTAVDKRSPAPPEPSYTDWLRDLHGDEWPRFHWGSAALSGNSSEIPQNLEESFSKLGGNLPVGVGVGVGVGNGVVEDQKKESSSPSSGQPSISNAKPSHDAEKLAELFKTEILRNKPDYKISQSQVRSWAVTADRMIRLDGRTFEAIDALIRWVQADSFWCSNVLSMDKLREKFDQLELKASAPKSRSEQIREALKADDDEEFEEQCVRAQREREAKAKRFSGGRGPRSMSSMDYESGIPEHLLSHESDGVAQ